MESANNRLVIVLAEHPILGMLLTPFMVESIPGKEELLLVEQAFHLSETVIKGLSKAEQQAIEIAEHYTEKYLRNVYSKEKVTAKFLKSLQQKPEVWKKVRHFIDKKMLEMVELARRESLPIYQKPNGSKVLYPHHLFSLHPEFVDCMLLFNYTNDKLSYRLRCAYQGEPISLTEEKPAAALTFSPTTLILGMNLYFFEHLAASLLLPLTKKEQIIIETPTIDKYIDNILVPIARYHQVIASGVVLEELHYPCQPILYFEETVYETQMLRLNFRYNTHQYAVNKEWKEERYLFCKQGDEQKEVYY